MKTTITPPLFLLALLTGIIQLHAQGTAFTYQGHLTDGGQAAGGLYDFRAQVYNRAVAGEPGDALVSTTLTLPAVLVTNGLFVLNLDFGMTPFNGEARWLLVQVRTNTAPAFTALVPRQPVTPTPYSIMSGNLAGPLPAAQLTGTVSVATLPSGGNWALNSTLTLDTSTLAIDPVNNRVGIGTASPAWPLDMSANQAVTRMVSEFNVFGSVIELRNNTASPTYLGAINFQNAGATYPGQIGYTGSDALTFRTAGAEHMRLGDSGRLDVTSLNSSVAINVVDSVPPFSFFRGVKATSDSLFGTAVFGISSDGIAIAGTSANGTAGSFSGPVRVAMTSTLTRPQLRLSDNQDGNYARLEFQVANRPYWHLAVGGGAANQMNFYNSTNGDVMSLTENGTLFVKVLTITGGADIAEPFQMSQPNLAKGSVVVIDEENPGQLKLSAEPYDRRVAGIISGAGGVNPGLRLSQQGVMDGDQHVALTGRVYVQADTSNGPIKPGDLLTTSSKPGRAMKVTDHARAQGATLGKAMTGLKEGESLVLVLVTLH